MITHLGQGSSLVRADYRDSSQCLHGRQRFAKDLVLFHDIGHNGKTHCQRNRKAFWDESNADTNAVHYERGDIDPVWMISPKPRGP